MKKIKLIGIIITITLTLVLTLPFAACTPSLVPQEPVEGLSSAQVDDIRLAYMKEDSFGYKSADIVTVGKYLGKVYDSGIEFSIIIVAINHYVAHNDIYLKGGICVAYFDPEGDHAGRHDLEGRIQDVYSQMYLSDEVHTEINKIVYEAEIGQNA